MKRFLRQLVVFKLDGPMEVLLGTAILIGAMDVVMGPALGPMMDGEDIVGIPWQQNGAVVGPKET